MNEILQYCFSISLKITCIHVLFLQGMIFGKVRSEVATKFDKWFGLSKSKYIQKPLWGCLICMSSIWSLFFLSIDHGLTNFFFIAEVIMIVCGMNTLIDHLLYSNKNE